MIGPSSPPCPECGRGGYVHAADCAAIDETRGTQPMSNRYGTWGGPRPERPTIPTHQHVPACESHMCSVCPDCGKLTHAGSFGYCMGCFIDNHLPRSR